MGLIACKLAAVVSTAGVGVLAQLDPVTTGQRIGQMTATGILGVVAVSAVVGMVVLYRDQRKENKENQEQLLELVKNTSAVAEASAKAVDANTEALRENVEAIKLCQNQHGPGGEG